MEGADALELIVNVRLAELVLWLESVTVKVTVLLPEVLGVPVSNPAVLTLRPVGKPLAFHVYGEAPPVAANWYE